MLPFFSLSPPASNFLSLHNFYYFIAMLRVGHQNVYHLYNKVPDLCVFPSQSTTSCNISDITVTTRLQKLLTGILTFEIIVFLERLIGQTGIAVYTHYNVVDIAYRHQDLESDHADCICFQLKPTCA